MGHGLTGALEAQLKLDFNPVNPPGSLDERIYRDLTGSRSFFSLVYKILNKEAVEGILKHLFYEDGSGIIPPGRSGSIAKNVNLDNWNEFFWGYYMKKSRNSRSQKGEYAITPETRAYIGNLVREEKISLHDFISFYIGLFWMHAPRKPKYRSRYKHRPNQEKLEIMQNKDGIKSRLGELGPEESVKYIVNAGRRARGLYVNRQFPYDPWMSRNPANN